MADTPATGARRSSVPGWPRRLRCGLARLLATGCLLIGAAVWAATFKDWPSGYPHAYGVLAAALAGWAIPAMLVAAILFLIGRSRAAAVLAITLTLAVILTRPPHPWLGAPGPRGTSPDLAAAGLTPTSGAGQSVRVMSLNMLFGRADAGAVVAAVREHQVDALVLTELTPRAVRALEAGGLPKELPYSMLAPGTTAEGIGIYSRLPLSRAEQLSGIATSATLDVTLRLAVAHGVAQPAPTLRLIAAHPPPPTSQEDWHGSFAFLASLVDSQPEQMTVLAGDLNASVFNAPLARLLDHGLRDAASTRSWPWQLATWPSPVSGSEGVYPGLPSERMFPVIRIDHVLVSDRVSVEEVSSITIPGTDHRGVLAALTVG